MCFNEGRWDINGWPKTQLTNEKSIKVEGNRKSRVEMKDTEEAVSLASCSILNSQAYQRETVVSGIHTHTHTQKIYRLIDEIELVCLPSRQHLNIKRDVCMCLDDRLDFIKCTLTHTAKLIQCAPRPCHVIVLLSYSELILSHSNHLVIL